MSAQNATLKNVFSYFEITTTCSGNYLVVKILDVQGRIAKTIKQTLEESVDKIKLNVEDLRKGKYTVNIFTDDTFVKAVQYTKI